MRGSPGDAFAGSAGGILSYKAKETTTAFESLGTPKSLIFRTEAGSIRWVMSTKPTETAGSFGNKRVDGSGLDFHQS